MQFFNSQRRQNSWQVPKQMSMQHQISDEDGNSSTGVRVVTAEDKRSEAVMLILHSTDNTNVKIVGIRMESVSVQHTENIVMHVAK